jgi:hypothetical protein
MSSGLFPLTLLEDHRECDCQRSRKDAEYRDLSVPIDISRLVAERSRDMIAKSPHPPHVIAAHHEAGHAVGAFFLGIPIRTVTIEGEGSGDGSFDTGVTWGQTKANGNWCDCAVVCWLGPVGEWKLFGASRSDCSDEDQMRLDEMISTFITNQAEQEEEECRLKRRAEEVTGQPQFMEAVRAVATELVKNMSLTGIEVQQIVERVRGDGHAS